MSPDFPWGMTHQQTHDPVCRVPRVNTQHASNNSEAQTNGLKVEQNDRRLGW